MAEIVYPSGAVLHANPDEPRGKALIDCGGNFNPNSALIWNLVLAMRPWKTVIDVGVNYGEMLVLGEIPAAAKWVGFEPNPLILPWLRKTVAGLSLPVTLVEAAVSDSARGAVEFDIDENWSGTSKLSIVKSEENHADKPSSFKTVSVPCTSIDAYFGASLASGFAMKIDVEGHELAVIRGAAASMNKAADWAILFEIHHMRTLKLATVAARHRLYLYDLESNRLVRAPRLNIWKLRAMRMDSRFYSQDAVLVSSDRLVNKTI